MVLSNRPDLDPTHLIQWGQTAKKANTNTFQPQQSCTIRSCYRNRDCQRETRLCLHPCNEHPHHSFQDQVYLNLYQNRGFVHNVMSCPMHARLLRPTDTVGTLPAQGKLLVKLLRYWRIQLFGCKTLSTTLYAEAYVSSRYLMMSELSNMATFWLGSCMRHDSIRR